jgi:hypothetical protein
MDTIVNLGSRVNQKQVFELRYDFGFIYMDRCGKVSTDILRSFEGWTFEGATPQSCTIRKETDNQAFSFGSHKLDLSQMTTVRMQKLSPPTEFAAVADTLSEKVVAGLGLTEFPRIGYRSWILFGVKDTEDGAKRLAGSEFMGRLLSLFKAKVGEVREGAIVAVLDRPNHSIRIEIGLVHQDVSIDPIVQRKALMSPHKLAGGQRQVLIDRLRAEKALEHAPAHAISVDMDFFLEDPPYPSALRVSDFISEAAEDQDKLLPVLLRAANG